MLRGYSLSPALLTPVNLIKGSVNSFITSSLDYMGYYRPEQGDGTGRGRERAPCSSAPLKRTYFHFSIKPVCKSWLSHLANLHAELPSSSLQSSTSGDLRVLFRAQWHRQDSFIARDQPSHAPDTGMTMPCTGRDKNKRTGDKVGHAQTGEENTYLFACV